MSDSPDTMNGPAGSDELPLRGPEPPRSEQIVQDLREQTTEALQRTAARVRLDQGFLHAIAREPQDDATRLIYADWLEDQGGQAQVARAELIRLQCELARPPPREIADGEKRARLAQLMATFGRAFVVDEMARLLADVDDDSWRALRQPAENGQLGGHFECGFLTAFQLSPVTFLRLGPAAAHLGQVEILPAQSCAETEALSHSQALEDISMLSLREDLPADQVWAILRSAHLVGVETLEVRGKEWDHERVVELLQLPVTSRLRCLRLVGSKGLDLAEELVDLLASDRLRDLEELDLSECGLRTEHAFVITEAGRLPALRRLILKENDLDNDVLAILSCAHPALQTVDLRNSGGHQLEFAHLGQADSLYGAQCWTPDDALAISRCPDPTQIEALELFGNLPTESLDLLGSRLTRLRDLTFRDEDVLANLPWNAVSWGAACRVWHPVLESLTTCKRLSPGHWQEFIAHVWPQLSELITDGPLPREFARQLAECLPRVGYLQIINGRIDASITTYLARGEWNHLRTLALDSCSIDDPAVLVPLVAAPWWPRLRSVSLCDNPLEDETARFLIPRLPCELEILNLKDCCIEDLAVLWTCSPGVRARLRSLFLDDNEGAAGLTLVEILDCFPDLRELGIAGCSVTLEGCRWLAQDPRLAHLERLSLGASTASSEAIRVLLTSSHLSPSVRRSLVMDLSRLE